MSELYSQARDIIAEAISKTFPDNPELLANLDSMIKSAIEKGLSAGIKNKDLALDFLNEAEIDIKTCHALYNKKIYSRAIFSLQQAVEKATKGYVLAFGHMDLPEVYTHNTPALLLEASLEKTGIRDWAKKISDQRISSKIEKAYDTLKDNTSRQVISQITYREIKQFLTRIDEFEHSVLVMQDFISRQLSDLSIYNGKPIVDESLSYWTVLYGLAIITHSHEATSRYPNAAITPSSIYTKSLGIVRTTPDIAKRLKRTVIVMNRRIGLA